MSIMPPHQPDRPESLMMFGHVLEETIKHLERSVTAKKSYPVRRMYALLRDGTYGMHECVLSDERAQTTVAWLQRKSANSQSFLVYFALEARGIVNTRLAWEELYQEVSRHIASLNSLLGGKRVSIGDRVMLRIFMAELADWMIPEIRRQVAQ